MTAESGDPAPRVTGVVLAGGRSSRFGGDKLAAEVDGRSLLQLAVEAVAAVAEEVLVVCAPDDERRLPVAAIPVRRIHDPEPFGGPLVGLRAGLEAAAEPIVVAVGGDMPRIRPVVLEALIRALIAAPATKAAAVLVSRGRIVPLPAALRTGAATDRIARLVDDGERRLGSVFERWPIRILEEAEWRPLDPAGDTLRDVDRPDDL